MIRKHISVAMWGAAIVAALVIAERPVSAQKTGTVSGTVVSSETSAPVLKAKVTISETGATAETDFDGTFTLENVPPGQYTLQITLDGYLPDEQTITVEAGKPLSLDVIQFVPISSEVITIVGVGQRTERTVLESPVPIDTIPAKAIAEASQTETNQVLATVAPSYNATHQAISDGTDHINPASLRGLGPDQVLILVNGKRRHPSSLVNVNGTFGRGTVGYDLNAIPTSAIKRIEVLRDGAASQYGSDAIAGVINVVLKDSTDVLDFTTQTGITGSGDGGVVKLGANRGWQIGNGGFLNFSGEVLLRDKTQRAEPWTGQIFPGVTEDTDTEAILAQRGQTRDDYTMNVGQSAALASMLYMNGSLPLGNTAEAYTFGGYTYRKGYASGFYRLPFQEERVDLDIHPNGFLPEINPELQDWSIGGGLKGQFACRPAAKEGDKPSCSSWDLSVTHGGNSFQFFIDNSLNASLGNTSPTSFDAGRMQFFQTTINGDVVYPIALKAFKSLAVVAGAELRNENYQIFAGDEASYAAGPETTSDGSPKTPGSQVFPGFQPFNQVRKLRNSQSLYAGIESQINPKVTLDIGGRFEHYSDFGNTVIGKLATRVEVIENVALRGAVSTGFRAPSLHQVWFSNVSTQFVDDPITNTLEPRQVLTSPNSDPVTQAFGIPELKEETSLNISTGVTARPMENLSVSADFYRIQIDDRIVLTSRFGGGTCDETAESYTPVGCAVSTILSPFPSVSQAQFFTNAVDTTTNGVDLVVNYGVPMPENRGRLNLTLSGNFTSTTVGDDITAPQSLVDMLGADDVEQVETLVFNREERNRLEDALPRQKATLGANYVWKQLSTRARARYYGPVEFKPTNPENDESFGAKVLLDLDLGYELGPWRVAVGADNVFNTFPDQNQLETNISNGRFVYSRRVSQFGINGGFYYLKLQYLN